MIAGIVESTGPSLLYLLINSLSGTLDPSGLFVYKFGAASVLHSHGLYIDSP